VDKFWGFAKFVQKSKLPQVMPGVDNNDCFTIRCNLMVMKEPRTEAVSTIVVPPSNLHQHFASMLKNGKGVDVKFSVGRQLFSAHACVLGARSPAGLYGRAFWLDEGSTASCIEVEDMEPFIFETLLHFIYTDSLPESLYIATSAATQNLLVAADRYGVDRLKAMCEEKRCIHIGVQTVATTLALVDQHHCVELKDACLRFLSSGDDVRQAMKGTDGFKHLATSYPSLMMEIV
jgi:speckle-type POZ protein